MFDDFSWLPVDKKNYFLIKIPMLAQNIETSVFARSKTEYKI
jgi:hypothetical protein